MLSDEWPVSGSAAFPQLLRADYASRALRPGSSAHAHQPGDRACVPAAATGAGAQAAPLMPPKMVPVPLRPRLRLPAWPGPGGAWVDGKPEPALLAAWGSPARGHPKPWLAAANQRRYVLAAALV
jgi:hypothetical protein